MKNLILLFILIAATLQASASFDEWFINKALRVDYYHTGNSSSEIYSLTRLKRNLIGADRMLT